jgi:hypothetical protein
MPEVRALNAFISDSLCHSVSTQTPGQANCVHPIDEDTANAPHIIHMQAPTYPEEATQQGLQGWVLLLFMIRADGTEGTGTRRALRGN